MQEITFAVLLDGGFRFTFRVEYDEPLNVTDAHAAAHAFVTTSASPVIDTDGKAWTINPTHLVALRSERIHVHGADGTIRDETGRLIGRQPEATS